MLIDILRKVLPLSVKQGFGLWTVAQAGRSKWLAYPYYLLLCGKTPRGLRMCGDVCVVDYKGREIITPRDGLLAVIDIFQDKVYEKQWSPRKGDVVFDVGSYVGMFAINASGLVGGNGRVVAIEPEPSNFNYLAGNVKGLGNITLVKKAMSEKEGKATFYLSNASPCHSLVMMKQKKKVGMATDTLDNVALKLGIEQVDFIKIDAEGAELDILRGAEKVLG